MKSNREREKKRTVRGEITAFLSLVFVLLVSFILALTESSMIQTSKNQKRMDVDRALYSVFGEYQKDLLEDYDIFAFDMSYGSGQFEEDLLLNRMAYYGNPGIEQEITDLQFLTDNGGQAFREQVLAYMESKDGIDLIQNLVGLSEKWEEQEIKGEAVSEEIDQLIGQNEEILPEEFDGITEAKKSGLLSLVLPKTFILSSKSVNQAEMLSAGNKESGWGSFPQRSNTGGIKGKVLYEQYILETFGSATEPHGKNRNLDYEIEYMISGKSSDEENLRSVVRQLFCFRLAMNYVYLLSDAKKQGEAEVLALALAAVALHPEAAEGLKQILLLLWCFGESVMDLRALLSGKRAALMKSEETWQLSLESVFRIGSGEDGMEGMDAEDGMTYMQYLQILLFMKGEEELTMRTLDRIEQNIRFEKGHSHFHADQCVTKLKVKSTAEIRTGITYSFPAYFGYS